MSVRFRLSVCLLLSLLIVAGGAGAADRAVKNYGIRLNLVDLFVGNYGLDADYVVAERLTVGATAGVVTATSGTVRISAWRAGIRGNWHFKGVTRDGWYLAPFFQYNPVEASELAAATDGRVVRTTREGVFGGGVIFGRFWIWDTGLNIRVGAGPAFFKTPPTYNPKSRDSIELFWFAGLLPAGEVSVGYSF